MNRPQSLERRFAAHRRLRDLIRLVNAEYQITKTSNPDQRKLVDMRQVFFTFDVFPRRFCSNSSNRETFRAEKIIALFRSYFCGLINRKSRILTKYVGSFPVTEHTFASVIFFEEQTPSFFFVFADAEGISRHIAIYIERMRFSRA